MLVSAVLLWSAVTAQAAAPPVRNPGGPANAEPAPVKSAVVEESLDLLDDARAALENSLGLLVEVEDPAPPAAPKAAPLPKIDPNTPTAKLLPEAPKVNRAPIYLGDDLKRVPEVTFEAPPTGAVKLTTPLWIKKKAQTAAAVQHLNAKEEDGFLKALVKARPELSGLPFIMGKDCRADEDRSKALDHTAREMHRMAEPTFYMSLKNQRAHIAVMSQNLIAHDNTVQPRALRALTSTRQSDATKALARAAVFSPDEALRSQALKALAKRPAEESKDVLLGGLRYPWPAVAQNAARAIVELKRTDLIPQLKAVLDEPDPRGPRKATADGKKVMVAHELVRINHLRNCMLCHPPAEQGKIPEGTLVADIPLPSEPLPSFGNYFDESQRSPSRLNNLLVRIDMTYLRQDFSAMGEVAEQAPWPAQQRFDYVVRKRVLTPEEAADLRKRLEGESPYRKAAAKALRELTGRDTQAKSRS